jgi:hypothetical protein
VLSISYSDDCDNLNKAINGISTKDQNSERDFGLHSVFEVLTKGMQGEGIIIPGRGILSRKLYLHIQIPS